MGVIRLACYTGPWGAEGFVQAITDIGQTGFEGLEVPASIVNLYEDRLHVFEEILDTSSLRLAGLLQGVDLLDKDRADEQVERAVNAARFASAAGRGMLTVIHAGEPREKLAEDEWPVVAAVVEEVGQRCAEFGVQMCFLPRAQHLLYSESDISRFLAMTDPGLVSLSLDTAEMVLGGSKPQRIIKNHVDRIKCVRYREASGSKRRSKTTSNRPGSTPQFGRGAVNFEETSKALLSSGYSGWVVMDVSGDAQPPAEAAATGYRYLIRKSGLYSL